MKNEEGKNLKKIVVPLRTMGRLRKRGVTAPKLRESHKRGKKTKGGTQNVWGRE